MNNSDERNKHIESAKAYLTKIDMLLILVSSDNTLAYTRTEDKKERRKHEIITDKLNKLRKDSEKLLENMGKLTSTPPLS